MKKRCLVVKALQSGGLDCVPGSASCVFGPARAAVSTRGFQLYNRKNTFLTLWEVERLSRCVHTRCSKIGERKVGQKCRV